MSLQSYRLSRVGGLVKRLLEGKRDLGRRPRPGRLMWLHLTFASLFWIGTGMAAGGISWFGGFLRFFAVQAPNGVTFPVTYGMAWIIFLSILYLKRGLGWRGFAIAGTAPFGGAGLFELLQDVTGTVLQPTVWIFNGWGLLNLLAWVLLGLTGMYYWKLGRVWWFLALSYPVLWILWGLKGFPQVTWGSFSQYPLAYIFTILLKVESYIIFGLPIWNEVVTHHPDNALRTPER